MVYSTKTIKCSVNNNKIKKTTVSKRKRKRIMERKTGKIRCQSQVVTYFQNFFPFLEVQIDQFYSCLQQ